MTFSHKGFYLHQASAERVSPKRRNCLIIAKKQYIAKIRGKNILSKKCNTLSATIIQFLPKKSLI